MATKNEKKMTKSYFDVLGICCTSEVPLIENILNSLDGVKEYSVIVPSRTVIVVHDSLIISQFNIGKALTKNIFSYFNLYTIYFFSVSYFNKCPTQKMIGLALQTSYL